jgi:hypothetical protein
MTPGALKNLRTHVSSAEGFALVNSVVELLGNESNKMIVEGLERESYHYKGAFPNPSPDRPAAVFFGQAVLLPHLRD